MRSTKKVWLESGETEASLYRTGGHHMLAGLVGRGKELEFYSKFKRKLLKYFEHMLCGECNVGAHKWKERDCFKF